MPLPKALLLGSPVVPSGGLAPTTAAAAPAGGNATVTPGKGGLPFTMQTQIQDNWCWAAVATSTSLHYNFSSGWTQCKVANKILARPSGVDCCASGSDPECDVEWCLDKALTETSNLHDVRAGAVGFPELTALLDGDRPLAARVEWAG